MLRTKEIILLNLAKKRFVLCQNLNQIFRSFYKNWSNIKFDTKMKWRVFYWDPTRLHRTPPKRDEIAYTLLEYTVKGWGYLKSMVMKVKGNQKCLKTGSKLKNSHFSVKYTPKFCRKCVDVSKIWYNQRIQRHRIALWDLFDLDFM